MIGGWADGEGQHVVVQHHDGVQIDLVHAREGVDEEGTGREQLTRPSTLDMAFPNPPARRCPGRAGQLAPCITFAARRLRCRASHGSSLSGVKSSMATKVKRTRYIPKCPIAESHKFTGATLTILSTSTLLESPMIDFLAIR